MTHDVFISYSRADVAIADEICESLNKAGITYWIDRGGITSGEAFHAAIVRAIRESKITIFISSANSNMSEYTIKEIVIAFKSKKHIIPFCIDEEPFADKLEFYLCDLDQLAYYIEKEFAIQKLIGDISKLLNKKPVESVAAHSHIPEKQFMGVVSHKCLLKIRSNMGCEVWVDGEHITKAEANQITKIPLNKGTFWLEFISMENEEDKYTCEYTIANPEELLTVDLASINVKRKEFISTKPTEERFTTLGIIEERDVDPIIGDNLRTNYFRTKEPFKSLKNRE